MQLPHLRLLGLELIVEWAQPVSSQIVYGWIGLGILSWACSLSSSSILLDQGFDRTRNDLREHVAGVHGRGLSVKVMWL